MDPFSFKAFEFDSPIEFALIGTLNNVPAVLAKSKGAQIDLAAYAQNSFDEENIPKSSPFFVEILFPKAQNLRPFSITTVVEISPNEFGFGTRRPVLTLVWRGIQDPKLKSELDRLFEPLSINIMSAIGRRSESELEWSLSPLIDLCNRAKLRNKEKRLRYSGRAAIFTLTITLYSLIALIFTARGFFKL